MSYEVFLANTEEQLADGASLRLVIDATSQLERLLNLATAHRLAFLILPLATSTTTEGV